MQEFFEDFFRYFRALPVFSAEALPAYLFGAILGSLVFLPALILSRSIPSHRPFFEVLRSQKSISGKEICFLLSGTLSGFLTVWRYGLTLAGLSVLLTLALFAAVSSIDRATLEIPDRFPLAMLVIGLLSFFTMPDVLWYERLIGFFSVSLPLLLITFLVPGAFGGGDIKLMAPVGLFLGWKLSLVAAFAAILTGGFYGIWILIRKKQDRKSEFAFGPFLCFGSAFSLFLGSPIVAYYADLFSVFS